jgi:hypothetical protein
VKKIIRKVRPNQKAELDYVTMTLDEIKALPVQNIAAENAVLFLWTTHAFLESAFDVMRAWGFKYQRCLTWDKANGVCFFGFHHRTELCLFGYRGKIEMYPRRKAIPPCLPGSLSDTLRNRMSFTGWSNRSGKGELMFLRAAPVKAGACGAMRYNAELTWPRCAAEQYREL